MRGILVIFLALFAGLGSAQLYPQSFTCTGETRGDLCWLSDARMYAVARWHFTNVRFGEWTLVLEGEGHDPCATCSVGRDITVQVFWRESPDQPWNWTFVVLQNVVPETGPLGYKVRAELPLKLYGPELWVLVRRAVLCDPYPGFSWNSAYLLAPKLPEIPPPPPFVPEVPPPPPPLPPLPPVTKCQIGPLFACEPSGLPVECVPEGVNLATVARGKLLDTYGPGDAQALEIGHYEGEIFEGDYQDWYKFAVPKGEARLVHFGVSPGLNVDLYLIHDPCGTNLGVCLNVENEAVLYAPCQAGVECVTLPDGPTECFRGSTCGFFIRVVHKSGSGTYFLSILPAEIKP